MDGVLKRMLSNLYTFWLVFARVVRKSPKRHFGSSSEIDPFR